MEHALAQLGTSIVALAALLVGAPPVVGAADTGRVKCAISDNSKSASGSLTVLAAGGEQVAQGACNAQGLVVPAGRYTAVIALDGALDAPVQRRPVSVKAGGTHNVRAEFSTGTLKISIRRAGLPAAGSAAISRGGRQVGTVGNGVSAHLSVGRYRVVVRYRGKEKDLGEVQVAAGQTRSVSADFE